MLNKILLLFLVLIVQNVFSQFIFGCTDPEALNYNNVADANDFSCQYAHTTVQLSGNACKQLPSYINESSGLAFYNSLLWTHNDDGRALIFGLNPNTLAVEIQLELPIQVVDWEEIQIHNDILYIGDFGNNSDGARTDLNIYKYSFQTGLVETIRFTYNDQTTIDPVGPNQTNFDCEAFLVSDTMIYLFTKRWGDHQSGFYKLPNQSGAQVAVFQNLIPVDGLITGATFGKENEIVLVGYNALLVPFVISLKGFENDQFSRANLRKRRINKDFFQVEGIAYDRATQTYFISSEEFIFYGNYYAPNVCTFTWENILTTGSVSNENDWFKMSTKGVDVLTPNSVQIVDTMGKEMYRGEQQISLSFQDWTSGVYLIRNEKTGQSSRFLVQ